MLDKSIIANSDKEKVFKMAKSFAQQGRTEQNVGTYHKLDKQIRELAKGASSKVGKKKFGYMRNPNMTMYGRMLIVYRMTVRLETLPQRQR